MPGWIVGMMNIDEPSGKKTPVSAGHSPCVPVSLPRNSCNAWHAGGKPVWKTPPIHRIHHVSVVLLVTPLVWWWASTSMDSKLLLRKHWMETAMRSVCLVWPSSCSSCWRSGGLPVVPDGYRWFPVSRLLRLWQGKWRAYQPATTADWNGGHWTGAVGEIMFLFLIEIGNWPSRYCKLGITSIDNHHGKTMWYRSSSAIMGDLI